MKLSGSGSFGSETQPVTIAPPKIGRRSIFQPSCKIRLRLFASHNIVESCGPTSPCFGRLRTLQFHLAKTAAETKSSERPGRAKRSSAKKPAAPSAKATKASPRRKPDSKQDQIVALLQQPGGATLDGLVKATGWQKHSVRGFLAGTVRKKLKLPLLSEKIDGIRTYRIGASRAVKAAKKRRSA